MAISKVIYGGTTLIDLTADTVDSASLLQGKTAHGKDGEVVVGTCNYDVDSSEVTATAAEILAGKTAGVKGSIVTGTMTNNGAVAGTIAAKTQVYTIPQGYHDGSGTVQIDADEQTKIIAENIRSGVTILGVTGSMSGTEGANAQSKTVTPTTTSQEVLPDTADGYNYLASVIVAAIPYAEATNSAGGTTVTIG